MSEHGIQVDGHSVYGATGRRGVFEVFFSLLAGNEAATGGQPPTTGLDGSINGLETSDCMFMEQVGRVWTQGHQGYIHKTANRSWEGTLSMAAARLQWT
jgi:hypothetical protein